MIRKSITVLILGLTTTSAMAADVPSFHNTALIDSGKLIAKVKAQPGKITAKAEDAAMTASFDDLVASADARKLEAAVHIKSNLTATQTAVQSGKIMTITLKGHIIKSAGSVAQLDLKFGALQKTIKWSADEMQTGAFTRTVNVAAPKDLVSAPLPIEATLLLNRTAASAPIMVSVKTISVSFHDTSSVDKIVQR